MNSEFNDVSAFFETEADSRVEIEWSDRTRTALSTSLTNPTEEELTRALQDSQGFDITPIAIYLTTAFRGLFHECECGRMHTSNDSGNKHRDYLYMSIFL